MSSVKRSAGAWVAISLVLVFGASGVLELPWGNASAGNQASGDKAIPAESPARVLRHSLWSAALGREMVYNVFLPPGYDSHPHESYPVAYMLHSLGGNYMDWEKVGLFSAAGDLMQSGEVSPIIIVTPEGEAGYWVDHANNGPRFGSYVSKDLVTKIDGEFRTIRDGSFRAIGGMSMGGHGALQLALTNPGEFGIVGAHSVALRRKEEAFDFFGDRVYFEAHDPVSLCKADAALARRMTIWIDIGDQDRWLGPAESYHELLTSQKVAHSWTVFKGGHEVGYWRSHVVDYLRFYGSAFDNAEYLLAQQAS